jgi:hypothetical protein
LACANGRAKPTLETGLLGPPWLAELSLSCPTSSLYADRMETSFSQLPCQAAEATPIPAPSAVGMQRN